MVDPLIVKVTILAALSGTTVFSFWFFPGKKKEITLALFAGFLSLCMAEVLLRTFYPQINQHDNMFEYDPLLGWRFVPNKRGSIEFPGVAGHYIRTNSLGFRDDPLPSENHELSKILIVGDSFVSNMAVQDNEVFTEVMQQRLPLTSVLNFGVNGYSTVQEYLLLQQKIKDVDPDVVILVIYIRNDFTENMGEDWLRFPRPRAIWNGERSAIELLPAPPAPPAPPAKSYFTSVLLSYKQLHLNELINKSVAMLPRGTPTTYAPSAITPAELYLCRKDLSPDIQMLYRVMEGMLLKIQGLMSENHKPVLFVLAPSMVQVDGELMSSTLQHYGAKESDYSFSLPNDTLMSFAKENGLQMVDLLPFLRSEGTKGKPLYNRQEQHWSSEGNRVVAAILLQHLRSLSLVH